MPTTRTHKFYGDRHKARVRRRLSDRPMHDVVGDVHHVDILVAPLADPVRVKLIGCGALRRTCRLTCRACWPLRQTGIRCASTRQSNVAWAFWTRPASLPGQCPRKRRRQRKTPGFAISMTITLPLDRAGKARGQRAQPLASLVQRDHSEVSHVTRTICYHQNPRAFNPVGRDRAGGGRRGPCPGQGAGRDRQELCPGPDLRCHDRGRGPRYPRHPTPAIEGSIAAFLNEALGAMAQLSPSALDKADTLWRMLSGFAFGSFPRPRLLIGDEA